VEHNAEKKFAMIMPQYMENKLHLTPEFYEWLDRTSKQYEKAIIELSNI